MSVRNLARKKQGSSDILGDTEDPFSANKVTGYSLNFPIVGTCTPTVVCGERCYFAKGPSTWTASLAKQHRLLNAVRSDPTRVAAMIAASAKKRRMSFVRWNGGGDLFPESVVCLDLVAVELPDLPQWVVTRLPELASYVTPRDNVFVHFSVDRSSWPRLEEMRRLSPAGLKWFWSYQCDVGEVPPHPDVAAVIFRDGYDPKGSELLANDCPLNAADSIVRICESCRRCFNGEAVRVASELAWRPA